MRSNAYFLAKFRFDTAANEPAKNCKNFNQDIKVSHLQALADAADDPLLPPVPPQVHDDHRRHRALDGLRLGHRGGHGGRGRLPMLFLIPI